MAIQLYARCCPSYPIGAVSASNGSKIQTLDPSNSNTYWVKREISSGVYAFLLNNNTNLALTGVPGNFGSLTVSTYTGSSNQQWRYIDTGLGDSSHRFYAANNSSYCIDVNYGYSTVNAAVTMYRKDSSLDQCILEVSPGSKPQFACTTHSYVDYVINSNATCTSAGSKTQRCSVCGATRTVSIPALGHSYTAWKQIKAPTCTEAGSQSRSCTRCSNTWTQTINALGHSMVDVPAVEPTCTNTGLTAGKKCSRCWTWETTQSTVAALGHAWNSGEITKYATCTENGVKTFTCTRCGTTTTEQISAGGHTPASELSGYVAPTHTKPGYSGDIVCSVCGEIITRGQEIAAVGHTMGPWTPNGDEHIRICADGADCNIEREDHQFSDYQVTAPATCLTDGEEQCSCSVCEATKSRIIPAFGHNYVGRITTPANLKQIGTLTRECSRCDSVKKIKYLKLKKNKPKSNSI